MFRLGIAQGGYTPCIEITIDGREVSAVVYNRLISCTIRDEAGQTADTITITLDDRPPWLEQPAPNATIVVIGGYLETGTRHLGTFKLQKVAFKGSDEGTTMVIQGSAADLKTRLKDVDRESFEDTDVNAIVEAIATRNGLKAEIAKEVGEIKIDYRARVDTSEIDWLTQLGDEIGAVIKPMGDKLVAARMGEAKAVSGRNLPQIVITPEDCMSWEITPEGRPVYGKVVASYIDQRSGKRVKVESRTGLKGPNNTLKEPYPTKELAEKAAQAEARRLTRNTGEGQFVLAKGRLDTQAEADVLALDFRPGVAGDWRCHAVEREFASDGWGETIEIKGKEDGSSPGAKD